MKCCLHESGVPVLLSMGPEPPAEPATLLHMGLAQTLEAAGMRITNRHRLVARLTQLKPWRPRHAPELGEEGNPAMQDPLN